MNYSVHTWYERAKGRATSMNMKLEQSNKSHKDRLHSLVFIFCTGLTSFVFNKEWNAFFVFNIKYIYLYTLLVLMFIYFK
jgi:hypothetical protein